MDNIEHFINDAHGVYIPQVFAEIVSRDKVTGVTKEQYDILTEGPDHEFYWDVWDEVLNSAKLVVSCGKTFSLHQDGDLWLIGYDNASEEELDNFLVPGDWLH